MNQPIATPVQKAMRREWLFFAFVCAALLQLELVFDRPINWDEFYHLSQTHAFYQGRLTEALQVFYARAFFWLPMLAGDAIDQVRVARIFMFGCELFTAYAIYAMASRFTERMPAALAALAYLAGGYIFQHGFSYRADPMAAALLMGSLWTLLVSRLGPLAILCSALLAGLATLTTIKVVFYAPAFAGIAWLRWGEAEDRRAVLLATAAFASATVAFAGLFIGLTMLTLPRGSLESPADALSTAAATMFDGGLFPLLRFVLGAVAMAPITAMLVLTAPIDLARARLTPAQCIAIGGLLLPLASVVVYRNSYPYFYVFILPPVMVGAAISAREMLTRVPASVLSLALLLNAALVSLYTPRAVLAVQKQVLAAAHEVFPEPVAYFDYSGMLVDFPKANFFMSNWDLRKYWARREPLFVGIMSRETVPLLVIDKDVLENNQTGSTSAEQLLPEDARALRDAFIPHWGPLWVAGRSFSPEVREQRFTIYAPGTYTLEGGSARIDGYLYSTGEIVSLARGEHRFERMGGNGKMALRWGNNLKRPAYPFAGGPVFDDF